MSANSFGHLFKMTSFGESHGSALGVLVEGCPSGVSFNMELLKKNMNRRRPGQSSVTTSRNELDSPEVLSGVFKDMTLGTPICLMVKNADQRSEDYEKIENNPRIGHADDVWKIKFNHVDHRGGGRSSGRETVSRVLAGSVAEMLSTQIQPDLKVLGYASQIGSFKLTDHDLKEVWNQNIDSYSTRFPSKTQHQAVAEMLEKAILDGESYGGVVDLQIKGIPAGLGQPVFHKFKSDLASAMLSIGATIAVEFAEGAESVKLKGTSFHTQQNSNVYGGIRGGITTGEDILLRVAFKPTSSIKDTAKKGRHDPCIVTRAVPVVEAMAWLVIADHLLWSRLDKI